MSAADESKAEYILVCTPVLQPGGVERLCSRCAVSIYPHGNNLERVAADNITLICFDCSLKSSGEIGGVMHQGKVDNREAAEEVYSRYKKMKAYAEGK